MADRIVGCGYTINILQYQGIKSRDLKHSKRWSNFNKKIRESYISQFTVAGFQMSIGNCRFLTEIFKEIQLQH